MAPDEVRAELEKMLASDTFVNTDRLSRFLRFVVEKTLAGESAEIKEYPIGVEVFDRGNGFDPRVDPVVRVEARRLRAKLAEYYESAGLEDRVRICFRKGSYVPAFELAEGAPVTTVPPELSTRLPRVWRIAAVLVAAAVVAGAYWVVTRERMPVVAVFPMPATGAEESAVGRTLANGLAEGVTAELSRSGSAHVVSWPSVAEYRAQHAEVSFGPAAENLHAQYIVAISVHSTGDQARILAHLVEPARSRKLWAADYERRITDDRFAVERELSRAIADEIRGRLERGRW